ncbi:MAG TPA: response regulator [Phycisphaerae bacterium]|nr:response regulator [Phycisphaerae bacterium]
MKSLVSAWDVLVVDADPGVGELVKEQSNGLAQVRVATSVDQAQAEMKNKPADVLLVNMQINDNAGTEFIRALRRKYPGTELIAVSRVKRSDVCLDAWRAGASDMLLAPIQPNDVQRSLNGVAERRAQMERLTKRNLRLRQVCKQLNKARHEIGQQVDLLCNDLVRAYQEMAQQLNVTQITAEYSQALDEEIEVEGILRKTMEWVLRKVGPINAAVYLPDAERHFALGAYLNLDTEADALLINDIGETVVKQAESAGQAVAIDDDRAIEHLFGSAGERLKGRSWLSVACNVRRECLAVIVIFRSKVQPIDASIRTMIDAIAPVLGERIDQALGLYHRLHPYDYEDETSGD